MYNIVINKNLKTVIKDNKTKLGQTNCIILANSISLSIAMIILVCFSQNLQRHNNIRDPCYFINI